MKFFWAVAAVLFGLSAMAGAQNRLSRPPITGIAQVSVYTSDMAKARHFYGEFLGFPAKGRLYRVNAEQTIQVDPLPQGVTDNLASVAFATPDADGLRSYLLGKGVSVPDRIERQANGARWFWVKDPEGHRIEFVQASVQARLVPAVAYLQEPQVSREILHAGFIVHDRAAEDHFFRDVLGFHEGWQGGMKDNQIDWVDMQVPDGTDWIEYMIHGPGPVSAEESGVLNHFALGVQNMHEAMELLEQHGWHASPRQDAQIGRDGKWQLNLYDPDRTRVELMEFRPVEIPCCSPYSLR